MATVRNFKCHGDCPQWRIVTHSTTTANAVRINHAVGPLGIVQDRGGLNGDPGGCDVQMDGIGYVELGATLAYGAAIQSHTDNSGRAEANSDINWRIGRLLRGGVAGDIVPVLIIPH